MRCCVFGNNLVIGIIKIFIFYAFEIRSYSGLNFSGFIRNSLSRLTMKQSSFSSSIFVPSPKVLIYEDLKKISEETQVGLNILKELELREVGEGTPHTDCKLRLFGTSEEPRVVFYRDTAAWCPYCQKVWMMLEEKQIPYRVEKINMRAYGDKPASFLRKAPNGLLPAIELDGRFMTDSLVIMQVLEETFPTPPMLPPPGSSQRALAEQLLKLERELFYWWCQYCFRPGEGRNGGTKTAYAQTLTQVNSALEATEGPWFLGGDSPSIVDFAYVTHIERMIPSLLYWKGFRTRGTGDFPAVDRWLEAFEKRPTYMATKSDYYTHVMDIPPQYGPGFAVEGSEPYQAFIEGKDGSWSLPLPDLTSESLEPCIDENNPGPEAARQQAAFALLRNFERVVNFACRGAGLPGKKSFGAALADPYAEPNLELAEDVGIMLRYVAHSLLTSTDEMEPLLREDLSPTREPEKVQAVAICCDYLRDRVGVPRDMALPSALQLRAHLNWVKTLL